MRILTWCSSDLKLVKRIYRKASNIKYNKYYYCIYNIHKHIVDIYQGTGFVNY